MSEDFTIIPCKNGKQQLRESGKMRGTFTDVNATKAHASFLLEQREPPKPKTRKTSSIRHQKIFDHSVCSVVKALGRAGMKADAVEAVLRDHGIDMSSKSLRVQLGFGRNESSWARRGNPAQLTKSEIRELQKRPKH